MVNFIQKEFQVFRGRIEDIVKDLHQLTIKIGHDELAKTVHELRNRLHEPFMFVIVGEVKAGKSSFINALLETEKEICKVAPQPMTDTIQQIMWGETESVVVVNQYLKQVFQPIEILKEIAIVDTPGTNTIVEHHQEITERFIPSADLIVFVFEAKNPYRQSCWDFFEFIKQEWHKKVIFVLQQKDLMDADDLEVNIKGLKQQALKKGILDPNVFAVSAKDELAYRYDISGFSMIRDYIRTNITGGKAPLLKLQNNIDISENINDRIYKGLIIRKEQLNADRSFRNDISQTLDQQEDKSRKEVVMLIENLLAVFDKNTIKTERELSAGLNFGSLLKRSFASMFSSGASAKDWLFGLKKDLELNLKNDLQTKIQESIHELADSVQQMAKIIDLKIKNSKTILKDDQEIFSDIADRRSNVLRDLQEAFSRFLNRPENFTDEHMFSDQKSLVPSVATGSGMAVIGIILMAVTQTAVFDITGGILTTIGLIFAGVTIGLQRKKIIQSFHNEIQKGRDMLENEVQTRLSTYVRQIKLRIDNNFTHFDNHLALESQQIDELEADYLAIKNRLEVLKVEIES
jgi:ribosome biogenesis GTPase A